MASGFSRASAASALNFFWGKEEGPVKKPTKVFLALCTVEVKSSNTGVTITEATGAEGYARKEVPVASIHTAEEGETALIKTTAELIFNAITGGEAKVISWALCDSGETNKGNIVMYGQCTSTTISTTQTPPTVASEQLKGELK